MQRHAVACLCIVVALLALGACSHRGEAVKMHRFEQFLFAHEGEGAEFNTPLLNWAPDDPAFMRAVQEFTSDPGAQHIYHLTDSLYHDLEWLERDLGTAMSRARKACPAMGDYRFFTLVTGDYLNTYPNRVYCSESDMAIVLDLYAVGHVEEMQHFGLPAYQMRLLKRQYMLPDIMAAAARMQIAMPEGEMTFLDYAIAEGKTLYFLDEVLPRVDDTLKIRYTGEQMEWMEQNVQNVWGWLLQNQLLYSTDLSQLRNLLDEAPKTNAFGEGSAPRAGDYLGWQIVKRYMKKSGATMSELMAETDSRKILETSGWRP